MKRCQACAADEVSLRFLAGYSHSGFAYLPGAMGMSIMSNENSEGDVRAPAAIKLGDGLRLLLRKPGLELREYPTCRVQKGLIIASNSRELVEEGVGLGLPLVRFGTETVFPGDASISTQQEGNRVITRVSYNLNLIARKNLRWGGTIDSPRFYRVDEFFSRLHRRHPALRGALIWAWYPIKLLCGMNTTFREIDSAGAVSVVYDIIVGEGIIHTSVNLAGLKRKGCTEIIIANEQGANHFNLYRDSNEVILRGKEIGTWDETLAHRASLVDSHDGISFSINEVRGARIFRGRELVANHLAWSGLNYVLPGHTTSFSYDIRIGVVP